MAMMDNLSPELLVEIFSHYIRSEGHEEFLINIPPVCKDWNEASSSPSLWRKIRTGDPDFLVKISEKGLLFYTQSLELLFYEDDISDTDLSAVLGNIEDLKIFNVNSIACDNILELVAENCPNLERFRLNRATPMPPSNQWDQCLTVCGPTLRYLDLQYCFSWEIGQQIASLIATKCPLLQELIFIPAHGCHKTPFPILDLLSGCPCLRKLEFCDCRFITSGSNDSLVCGFKDLTMFSAAFSDFGGLDIFMLLKDSADLEHLELSSVTNLVLDNVWKIPSDKLKSLSILLQDRLNNFKSVGDAVSKWKHTLLHLELSFVTRDVGYMFERFLQDNPNPQITTLTIYGVIDPHCFKQFIQKCKNLIRFQMNLNIYNGHEKIKEAFERLTRGNNST